MIYNNQLKPANENNKNIPFIHLNEVKEVRLRSVSKFVNLSTTLF